MLFATVWKEISDSITQEYALIQGPESGEITVTSWGYLLLGERVPD